MKNFVQLKKEDKLAAYLYTAQQKHMSTTIVEKDFWVCFLLDILFHKSKYQNYFVFKGGTSLSKGYQLIERFSEDIDLVLDWRLLGLENNTPWEERSNRQQDRFNEETNRLAAVWIDETLRPELTKLVTKEKVLGFHFSIDANDPQTLLFHYPSVIEENITSVQKVVRLEIGPLASMTPTEKIAIISYVAEEVPNLFSTKSNPIKLVKAERTFWEKATILHKETYRQNNLVPLRYSRHYYDLYQMSKSVIKKRALSQPDLLEQAVIFKQKFYRANTAHYDLATIKDIRLLPNAKQIESLEKDYEQMQDMIFGDRPDFSDILKQLENLENEIHQLG